MSIVATIVARPLQLFTNVAFPHKGSGVLNFFEFFNVVNLFIFSLL